MEEKEKVIILVKKIKPFSEEIQRKIGRDREVVFAVNLLEKEKLDSTFQRISLVAHKAFPESFSFTEFPEFLDSRVVRNCLWHCTHKSKGWLIGSDKTNYSTTEKGREEISVFENLKNHNNPESLPSKMRFRKKDLRVRSEDKEIKYLNDIKKSLAFQKFMEKKYDEIFLLSIKKSLGGDRYSSSIYFENKMEKILELSKSYGEIKVTEYLIWVKANWRFK